MHTPNNPVTDQNPTNTETELEEIDFGRHYRGLELTTVLGESSNPVRTREELLEQYRTASHLEEIAPDALDEAIAFGKERGLIQESEESAVTLTQEGREAVLPMADLKW